MASEAMSFSAMHFFRMCCRSLVVRGCIALLANATETNRLAYLHGPVPVSIAINQIDRADPELQAWIQQGLSIEVHTMDYPCPLSKDSGFTEVKSNCDRLAFRDLPTSSTEVVTKIVPEPGPLSPHKLLQEIVVPEGLKVELVASEPLVMDPVAFDWGWDGRLWVVEMGDYPNGMRWNGPGDPKGDFGGRVKSLTDTDGDGVYDKASVFLDELSFPTAIKV